MANYTEGPPKPTAPEDAAPAPAPADPAAPKIRVKAPDGTIYRFPAGTPPEKMKTAIIQHQAQQKGDIYQMNPSELSPEESLQRRMVEAAPDSLKPAAEGVAAAGRGLHRLVNAATLGLADPAAAALAAGAARVTGQTDDFGKAYETIRGGLRRQSEHDETAHPIASTAIDIGGALLTPLPKVGWLRGARAVEGSEVAASAVPRIVGSNLKRNVAEAAIIGGVSGATGAEQNNLDVASGAGEGAGVGALLSAATHGIIRSPRLLKPIFGGERAATNLRNLRASGAEGDLLTAGTGRFPNALAKATRGAPLVGERLGTKYNRAVEDVGGHLERTAAGVEQTTERLRGPTHGMEATGRAIKEGLQTRMGERPTYGMLSPDEARRITSGSARRGATYREMEDALFTEAHHSTRGLRVVPVHTIQALREVLTPTTSAAFNRTKGGPMRQTLRAMLNRDPETGRLTERFDMQSLQTMRREIGEGLKGQGDFRDLGQSQLSRIYKSLSDDMRRMATTAERLRPGSNATRLFERANRFVERGRRGYGALEGMMGDNAAEAVAGRLLRAGREKGGDWKLVQQTKVSMSPQHWNAVRAGLIREMGRPTPGSAAATAGATFSPTVFMTEFNKLSEKARNAFFERRGNAVRENIEIIRQNASQFKNLEYLENRSNTANVGGAAATAVGSLTALPVTLKLLGSAAAFNRLITSPRAAGVILGVARARTPLQVEQAAARLSALARLTGASAGEVAGETAPPPVKTGPQSAADPSAGAPVLRPRKAASAG